MGGIRRAAVRRRGLANVAELPERPNAGLARDSVGDLKLCARCLEWKDLSEFHNSRTGQFSYCRDCRNAYDRQYYVESGRGPRLARKRAAVAAARSWMAGIKEGVPCSDCGGLFPVYVMHWDHLPGFEKVDEISSMVASRTRAAVLEELKKCELVCANCHVMRTIDPKRRGARSRRRRVASEEPPAPVRTVGVGGFEPPTTSA